MKISIVRDALLTLRHQILCKGERMTEYDWRRINDIDETLEAL